MGASPLQRVVSALASRKPRSKRESDKLLAGFVDDAISLCAEVNRPIRSRNP